jgi:hypothetical protein
MEEVSEEDLKVQKNKLRGQGRHNAKETLKFHVMKLQVKFDIVIDDDTHLTAQSYKDLRRESRTSGGKYSKKHKRDLLLD